MCIQVIICRPDFQVVLPNMACTGKHYTDNAVAVADLEKSKGGSQPQGDGY